MTVTVPANPAAPDRPDPEHLAASGLAEWLREDPAAAEEHEEAMRAGMHQYEMRRRKESADSALGEARARVSRLIDQHNLDGRRTLAFWLGSAIVLGLVVLDAIPLNWAAQAFGLNAADSWVVTLILLVASTGAMAALEAARHDSRRYLALVAVILTAYAGLVALRTSFLVTVAGESMAAAILQAVVLSAISAGLVFLGSAVMARTRPLRLSRALAAVRRARRASQVTEAAWRHAEDKLERHLGVLRRQLIRQPLYSCVPSGMTHPEWVDVLERVLRAQSAQR
ncbi:MAG: hypothetical protein ACLP5E_05390 [Streptosporangiaceae bacterium]